MPFNLVYNAIMATTAGEKMNLIHDLIDRRDQGCLFFSGTTHDQQSAPVKSIPFAGHPSALQWVHPRELKQRKLKSKEGRASFLHAIAHIEFNAINLALDAIYRFRDLPERYYLEWLQVAEEEANHHQLIVERLSDFGYVYGDFPVHNGLWDIAVRTEGDLLSRMALVPCVFEARGLDVTPGMIQKLINVDDNESADLLQFILGEEVRHVSIGVRWFQFVCEQRAVNAVDTFMSLVQTYLPHRRHGPLNESERLRAGFSEEWIARLSEL